MVLHEALFHCNVTDERGEPLDGKVVTSQNVINPRGFESVTMDTTADDTLHILMPFSTNTDSQSLLDIPQMNNSDSAFLPVLECPGSIHFYYKGSDPVGSDLLHVLEQGWPMLVLILLGASYSGIIIWILVS